MSTYVYAVVRTSHPLGEEPLKGVGDPPSPVRLLTEGDLAAAVSDTPDEPRAKRRDLMAHQRVLTELGASGPVLPMRFGSVAPGDEALRAVLREQREHFDDRLRELAERVEFNVKAAHREEPLLRRILAEDETVSDLNARTRRTGDQQDRLRLGELVAGAVQQWEGRHADLVRQTLRPLAAADCPGPERRDCLVNHSFLVDRTGAAEFRAAVDRLRQEHEELELSAHGPLPPYSFVEPEARDAPAARQDAARGRDTP